MRFAQCSARRTVAQYVGTGLAILLGLTIVLLVFRIFFTLIDFLFLLQILVNLFLFHGSYTVRQLLTANLLFSFHGLAANNAGYIVLLSLLGKQPTASIIHPSASCHCRCSCQQSSIDTAHDKWRQMVHSWLCLYDLSAAITETPVHDSVQTIG